MNSLSVIMNQQTDRPIAPEQEQMVCVRCGFCCDGTLFQHAHLNDGERGFLPEKIEMATFSESGKDYFRLPCRYFKGKCSIYDLKRADVCGSYRCQLLKDLSGGIVTASDAYDTVERAMDMRAQLLHEFRRLTGNRKRIHFRQLLSELGGMQKQPLTESQPGAELEILNARCNIFEAQLIKHFRSADDFERMVMK